MGAEIAGMITSLLGVVGASSIISGLVLKRIDKLERKLERRETDRVEENLARGELLHAAGRLAEANTVALRVITSDDVCKSELDEYRRAADTLEHFTREKSAEYLHAHRMGAR